VGYEEGVRALRGNRPEWDAYEFIGN